MNVKYFVNINNGGYSRRYIIYMGFVRASSVSTTTCIITTFSSFHFWASELFCNTCWFIFPMEKINQENVPNNLFHLSKISVRTFYLASYQSLDSFVYDSFVKKLLKKLYCFKWHLCKTKMFLFVWTNSWMHLSKLVISIMCVLIMKGCYETGSGWKFILIEKWANQICQKVKIVFFTWPQMWWPLRLGRHKDFPCLLDPLMPGVQNCNTYKNYFCCNFLYITSATNVLGRLKNKVSYYLMEF